MLVQKASSFPFARATLKGFSREEPDQARDGVTFEETLLMAEFLRAKGGMTNIMAAAAMLIQFDTYQRPKSVLDLLAKDAHPPSDARAARALQVWTLVFHPSTDNSYSKTRTQDDTIAIGASAAALAWIGRSAALVGL